MGLASFQSWELLRSGADVEWLGLARSRHFNFSQRCLAQTMNNSPRLYSWHCALGQVALGHPPSAKARFVCRTARWWSVIHHSRERISRVQWGRALHHSSQRLALHMMILSLCAVAWPWKLSSWSPWRTVLVLTLLPEAGRNSVVSVTTEDRTVPFCELVWPTTSWLSLCCS
jgi:hypothetical protein